MQAWRRKRRAIMRFCRACTGGCRTAPETWAGRLLAAAFVPVIAAKFLNTACQTRPHCGYTGVPAQNIRRGFTCRRCGYTVPDLR